MFQTNHPNDHPSRTETSELSADPLLDPSEKVGQAFADLAANDIGINPAIATGLQEPAVAAGLVEYCETSGNPLEEYLDNTARFSNLSRWSVANREKPISIPEGPDNRYESGRLRPEEKGYEIDLDYVRGQRVDPSKVLYFRVTQPMKDTTPKPEAYWTSDVLETLDGLQAELGDTAATAIILVATLEDIAKGGGLMSDINDDNGIAVRRRSMEPYDQNRALFSFARLTDDEARLKREQSAIADATRLIEDLGNDPHEVPERRTGVTRAISRVLQKLRG